MFSRFTLAIFGLLLSAYCQAQNIIFTSPNSTTPGSSNIIINQTFGSPQSFSGGANVIVGNGAGNAITTGNSNSFFGSSSGRINTTGGNNTFLGDVTGYNNTTANFNSFVGYAAGSHNISGNGNSFVGTGAGELNETGELNVFMGYLASSNNKSGNYNVAFGTTASYSNVTGNYTASFGHSAGASSKGSFNSFLGAQADVSWRNGLPVLINGSTAIGANSRVAVSNAIVLGDPTNTSLNVGIGTDSPQYPLDVRGIINIRGVGGTIRYSSLTNPTLINGTTDQFLTTNADGETVLARYRMSIASPDQWSDTVFSPAYRLQPLAEVEQFINTHHHLPGIPSADEVVKSGVDPAQITAKLLEKVEELTLYMVELQKENQALRQLVESRLPAKK